jgi:hypothetical protein
MAADVLPDLNQSDSALHVADCSHHYRNKHKKRVSLCCKHCLRHIKLLILSNHKLSLTARVSWYARSAAGSGTAHAPYRAVRLLTPPLQLPFVVERSTSSLCDVLCTERIAYVQLIYSALGLWRIIIILIAPPRLMTKVVYR